MKLLCIIYYFEMFSQYEVVSEAIHLEPVLVKTHLSFTTWFCRKGFAIKIQHSKHYLT